MADTIALNPDQVTLGTAAGPGVWIAPVGTTAPTDATSAYGAGWSTLGYLHEDGPKLSRSVDSTELVSWQSRTPLKKVITSVSQELEFTLLELSAQNLALYFGQTVPTETAGKFSLEIRSDAAVQEYAVGIDIADGDVAHRFIFPRATISDTGDVEFKADELAALPVTVTALDTNGVVSQWYKGTVSGGTLAAKSGSDSSSK